MQRWTQIQIYARMCRKDELERHFPLARQVSSWGFSVALQFNWMSMKQNIKIKPEFQSSILLQCLLLVSENILLPELPVLSYSNMLTGFEALFAYHQ